MIELLDRLQSVTPTMINLTFSPGAIGYDENVPNEAVVIGYSTTGILYWFNPLSLTFIRNATIWTKESVVLYNSSLFTSISGVGTIYVLNSQSNNPITNISHSSVNNTRRCMFINNGQTLIATAQSIQALSIFNMNSSTNYIFQQSIAYPFSAVHSLAKVNDTFFYASTWTSAHIVTYQYQNATWIYSLFANSTGGSGSHLAVDECGRVWQIIGTFGLRIYDSSGVQVAAWNMSLGSDSIYDIRLLPNYVLLLTRTTSKRIIQYDPQFSCS